MTEREVEQLFALADRKVDDIAEAGKKGAVAAYRFSTLLKVSYGWGLRVNEVSHLEATDFSRNPRQPRFGDVGILLVRHGKSSKGQPPKRRSVATTFSWAPAIVSDYIENIWQTTRIPDAASLWVTERGTRMSPREISGRFSAYRDELGFPRSLTFHSLRRSYATHLFEHGIDIEFIRRQLGHEYQTTTINYIHASEASANRLMDDALSRIHDQQK